MHARRSMDANWWLYLGLYARWENSFNTGSYTHAFSPAYSGPSWTPNWLRLNFSCGTDTIFFQAPFITAESDGGAQTIENNWDTGFFYLVAEDALGGFAESFPYVCSVPGMPTAAGFTANQVSQCAMLRPLLFDGEVRPQSDSDPLFSAFYKTGFMFLLGNVASLTYSHTVTWMKSLARGTTGHIAHYAPYAWNGSPPEVVASILLQLGMVIGTTEQTAFTNAHAAYEDTLGDIPIDGPADAVDVYWEPQVYCSRQVGQKVSDLVLEVMRHGRDLYYVNEAGVLDVSSFTRPLDTVTGLTLADGVTNVEWSWSIATVFNKVAAGWGSGYRAWGSPADAPDVTGLGCAKEDQLDSLIDSKYMHEASNAASIAKYGTIWLKGKKRRTSKTDPTAEITSQHFPLYLDPGCTDAQWALGYGGMMHVTNWLASDGKERRMITVVQDFRALDWGIGARLSNVAVTDDGLVVADAWCIEREYDFENLTTTSLLMEQPANT